MTKIFVTKENLKVENGYLVIDGDMNKPVYHEQFVKAQKKAEWLILFAEKCKGKDFNGKAPDSLKDIKKEVEVELAEKTRKFIEEPNLPSSTINDKRLKEALAFDSYQEKRSDTKKVNEYLQRFNVIDDFEKVGLYFDQDIVKLEKIYTIEEITEAVISVIKLL